MLANLCRNQLDRIWRARCGQLGIRIRYADDYPAMHRTGAAREALRRIEWGTNRPGLTLGPAKTRVADLRRVPDVRQFMVELTAVLRGWGNFRKGNADPAFNKMDSFVGKSLRQRQYRRGGQRPAKRPPFTGDQRYGMGVHRLKGTVPYSAQATPRRSSLSRLPEDGVHGLKGDARETDQPC